MAGYFCGEDMPQLDGIVTTGIEGELNRIIQGEEQWFDPQKVGLTARQLFEPLPEESPQTETIVTITDALSANVDRVTTSRDTIRFSLRSPSAALRDHPALATPAVIEGIRQLIAGFNNSGPGRGYYGQESGWILGHDVVLAEENDFPPYDDQVAMTHVVMDELIASACHAPTRIWRVVARDQPRRRDHGIVTLRIRGTRSSKDLPRIMNTSVFGGRCQT